jgi:predicted amidohydrolase YtcJ
MRSLRAFVLLALIAVQYLPAQILAVRNVTIINPHDRAVQPAMTVLVEGQRILAVQPASAPVSNTARLIDGKGKFLIPGLWDAHVHLTKAGVLSLPLFVANGVTSVRDMGSNFQEVSDWRRQIEAGKFLGPRIKTSGQIIESRANVERMKREATVEPVDRIRLPVANAEEGRAAVARLAALGVDHIKMRTTPDVDTFRAVAEEARRRRLPFTAHAVAPPEELLRAGLSSVEHVLAYPPLDGRSAADRRALFRQMSRSGMFMSVTQVNIEGSVYLPYAEGTRRLDDLRGKIDPVRRYVCGYLLADWREQVEEKKDSPLEVFRRQLPGAYRDLREMREADVPFLAGTDVGVAFMYPGFTFHDELQGLVKELGFTPMEALRIAAYHPAVFYSLEKELGSIAPGQAADLVLLDADPLADIGNTRRIRGVMVRGRWLDRAELDRQLQQIERRARSGCK